MFDRAPAAWLLMAALPACMPYSPRRAEPTVQPPPRYEAKASPAAKPAPAPPRSRQGWWTTFGDPELERLVALVLRDSLQLRSARARILAARASAAQSRSGMWPQVQAQAGWSRTNRVVPSPQFPASVTNLWSASLEASYEVDLWRRLDGAADAADLEAMATQSDREALAITLSALVAERWYDVVHARALRKLVASQVATNEVYLDLARLRFAKGLIGTLDVQQQRQQLEASRAAAHQAEGRLAVALRQLALLLGLSPHQMVVAPTDELIAPGPVPDPGLPSALLEQRPDVRAARQRLEAAELRIGSGIAARLPTLSLTGSLGVNSDALDTLADSDVWRVGATARLPLMDGFGRTSDVERRRAESEDVRARWSQVLLQAVIEVDTALALERTQRGELAALEVQLESARQALTVSRDSYEQGITDYLRVLIALQTLQRVELQELAARRQLVSNRIQLHRALGGTWTTEDLEDR